MHKMDPKHMERLLQPERRQSQNPEAILAAAGASAGMKLADIGAGPGFFTLPAAELVGPTGKVYALDIEPQMLQRLAERAAEAGVTNVETLVSTENAFPLPDSSVDVALLALVLHECRDAVLFLREIRRILRPDGTLAVVEWRNEPMEMGPPLAERMAPAAVEAALVAAGYTAVESFDAGPYHYGLRGCRTFLPGRTEEK